MYDVEAHGAAVQAKVLLSVRHLRKHYPVKKGLLLRTVASVKALDGVSLDVYAGETLGLVGESGSGKSTTARAIMHLDVPDAGEVHMTLDGPDGEQVVDLAQLNKAQAHRIRRQIQMVFQDPNSSLNPRMTIEQILTEPFRIHPDVLPEAQIAERIGQLLSDVGIRPEHRNRYPHQFSGGQRQRIGIARALAVNPRLVIADEPVSALDVSVQGQVLNLLVRLQRDHGLTYIMVAHDLSVVEQMCDRVAVMYLGRIVEIGSTGALFFTPRHPYTEALLSAVPTPDPFSKQDRIMLGGNIPSPLDPPSGCRFHTRCRYAKEGDRMAVCSTRDPELRVMLEGQEAACHFAEELTLAGARNESPEPAVPG